jgi:hypothetical protein
LWRTFKMIISDGTFRYRVYGLELDSALDLGPLPPGDPARDLDVTIRIGRVEPVAQGPNGEFRWYERDGETLRLDLLPAGRFRVTGGREIVVDEAVPASAALRWRLLGLASGALLHQRGALPIHATVVEMGSGGVGFAGQAGAGKSTLAGFLHQRGHPLLIDDISVPFIVGDKIELESGNGVFRLWRNSAESLGIAGGEAVDPRLEKYEFPTPLRGTGRIPLRALVELFVGDRVAIEPLPPAERLALCWRHTYMRDFLFDPAAVARNFRQCGEVAHRVPMFRLMRPAGFEHMDEIMGLIEREIAALA